jgi:hypothetical protein
MRTRHAGKEREEQPISEGQLLARFAFSIPLPDWDLPNLPRLDLPDIPWPDLPAISWLECRGNNRDDDLCGSGDRLQGAVPVRVSSHSRDPGRGSRSMPPSPDIARRSGSTSS